MGRTAKLNTTQPEGHGDENLAPQVTKGNFIDGGGTYVELGGMKPKATSSNVKTGNPGGVAPME